MPVSIRPSIVSLIEAGFRQYFVDMFAEARRPPSRAAGRLRKFYGNAGRAVAFALDQHVAVRHMRLRERLRHIVDGPRRHARAHQIAAEIVGLEAGQRALEFGAKGGDMFQPVGVGAETRIVEQILARHLLAETAELAVVENTQKNLTIAGCEFVVRRDVGMGAAEPAGDVARAEPVGRVRDQQIERGVEQRHLDALAHSGALARRQRQQHAGERIVSGDVIDNGNADAGGAGLLRAVDAHQARTSPAAPRRNRAARRAARRRRSRRWRNRPAAESAWTEHQSRYPSAPWCRAGNSPPARPHL